MRIQNIDVDVNKEKRAYIEKRCALFIENSKLLMGALENLQQTGPDTKVSYLNTSEAKMDILYEKYFTKLILPFFKENYQTFNEFHTEYLEYGPDIFKDNDSIYNPLTKAWSLYVVLSEVSSNGKVKGYDWEAYPILLRDILEIIIEFAENAHGHIVNELKVIEASQAA